MFNGIGQSSSEKFDMEREKKERTTLLPKFKMHFLNL